MTNKGNIRLWVQALRSGEYQQGKNYLRLEHTSGGVTSASLCCLGVACEVAIANGLDLKVEKHAADFGTHVEVTTRYGGEREFLPREVSDWLGMVNRRRIFGSHNHNPTINTIGDELSPQRTMNCTAANDDEKFTFAEIADMIEHTFLTEEKP